MRALTEFLLRETLTLLLDDPTPRNIAQAMGSAYAQDVSLSMESQTEESESQAPFVPELSQRVMIVEKTISSQQTVVLNDGKFSIRAFIPQALVDELKTKHAYKSIARLLGSTVRVDKYHFSTYDRCYALDHANAKHPQSVSTQKSQGSIAPIWLYVEALNVVVEGGLAVDRVPDILDQTAIAAQLKALSAIQLEQRMMLRQGLTPAVSSAAPSPAKRFDDHNPILDEECEIPEDQQRQLDAQGWGEPEGEEPTDSQLIAENGPVPSGDSQPSVVSSEGNAVVSSSANSDTFIASSGETASQASRTGTVRLVVPETEPQSGSPLKSQANNDEASVPDSQDYHFQRENLTKAFVDCSDTDSEHGDLEDDELEHEQAAVSQPFSQNESQAQQSTSQAPFTQQPSPDASLTLTDTMPTPASQASQPAGEFVGAVNPDHDEPMTQAPDDSQPIDDSMAESSMQSGSIQTQAEEACQAPKSPSGEESDTTPTDPDFGSPSDDVENITPNEVVDSPSSDVEKNVNEKKREEKHKKMYQLLFAVGNDLSKLPDTETSESEEKRDADASLQDGQADHWMQNSQPTPPKAKQTAAPQPTPPKVKQTAAVASPASASSQSGANVTQRRKRRRSSVSVAESQPLSPQEPNAKASRTQRATESATPTARSPSVPSAIAERGAATVDQDSVGPASNASNNSSCMALTLSTSSVNRVISIGISSLNNKVDQVQLQRLRPSKRYQHLLPPFDLEKIKQQILSKKN